MRTFLTALFVCLAVRAQNPTANLTVDVNANRRAINPNVYGLAYASTAQLLDLNVPLNRYGGNNTSRYNWQINGDNRGQDWYFESIGDTSAVAGERGRGNWWSHPMSHQIFALTRLLRDSADVLVCRLVDG